MKYIFLSILLLLVLAIGVPIITSNQVTLGINAHCGFYSTQGERVSPCKCYGVWTRGKLPIFWDDDNRAYCQGFMHWIFVR